MKRKVCGLVLTLGLFATNILWADDSGFSIGIQSGIGQQHSNTGKRQSMNFGSELRYAFNSAVIAHFEFDWAVTGNKHSTNFDPIGGLALNFPFGGGHSLQFGAGLDAIYAGIIAIIIAALASEDNNSNAADGLGQSLAENEFAGSRRLYFQSSYRYRFSKSIGGFIKGRYLKRDVDAGRFRSGAAVFLGAEVFLF